MAKDYHIRGYNTPQMAKVADHYKKILGIPDAEYVDIVNIIEFKVSKIYPNFRFIIKRDQDFPDEAFTDFENDSILVRESIYIAASEGDAKSRMILAHELGHYLLHRDKGAPKMHKTRDGAYDSIKELNSTESAEDQADMFAQHFLVLPALAFDLKEDALSLARFAKVPLHTAKTAISAAKRLSLRELTQRPHKQT
ncbi:hypothetical protein J2T08_002938 [Neorhizobium galegae]|uniref:ImmA/IrrE family metallo-endopeptidase n=1 Tax=Neorhizobium galegae TaxID=399 RepID=UPI00278B1567|nr:ImmA/IrrE family metallo-endopeptidase [Neorhizobium galegae]MDQ0135017.1 hypothetical protein [Neorhizobium galegae]